MTGSCALVRVFGRHFVYIARKVQAYYPFSIYFTFLQAAQNFGKQDLVKAT